MKKFLNSKISKYFFYMLLVTLFYSCSNQKNNEPNFYTWQTKLEVKYSDNTKDTILNTIELHKDYKPYFEIKTKEGGLFTDTKLVPCLTVSEASYYNGKNLACEVRTFRILTQTKHY